MRAAALLMVLIPVAASAQIDLTPTPMSARHVVYLLQQHAYPNQPASSDPVEWCVADAYRVLASQSEDSRIISVMRRVADQYEARGDRRMQRRPGGLAVTEGQEVVVQVTERATCRTRARVTYPIRG